MVWDTQSSHIDIRNLLPFRRASDRSCTAIRFTANALRDVASNKSPVLADPTSGKRLCGKFDTSIDSDHVVIRFQKWLDTWTM